MVSKKPSKELLSIPWSTDFDLSLSIFTDSSEYLTTTTTAKELTPNTEDGVPPGRKGLAFHMAFLSLCVSSFIVALDTTALSVAIPVRYFGSSIS
jgi:hypothetical protein